MANRMTLLDLCERALADHQPSVLEVWEKMGGRDDDLIELLHGTAVVLARAKTTKEVTEALVGLLGVGKDIGYYGALQTYDKVLGIGDKGGAPC